MRANVAIWAVLAVLLAVIPLDAFGTDVKKAPKKARGQKTSRAAVDPATGQIEPVPAPSREIDLQISGDLAESLGTSHRGLKEEPVPGVPGAYMVDLRGRFQTALIAVVHPDGSTETVCGAAVTASPTPSPKPEKKP
jgi:hypothetical protein